nr:TetR family transcriptional regulator [Micromonospora sp. DSM 115978]
LLNVLTGATVASRSAPPAVPEAVADADDGFVGVGGAKPAGGLRERKKNRTRAQFLEAANRLFDERGYDAVTVEDIASAIEVSTRTFFRYFRGKDELVLADVADQLATLLSSLERRPPTETAAQALSAAMLELAAAIDNRRDAFLRSHALISRSPHLVVANLAALQQWEACVHAQVRGRLSGADRHLRSRLLVGAYLVALQVASDAWAREPTCTFVERLGQALRLVRRLDESAD